MIGLLLAGWIGARALVWENPFAAAEALIPAALGPLAEAGGPAVAPGAAARTSAGATDAASPRRAGQSFPTRPARGDGSLMLLGSGLALGMDPQRAAAHQLLWRAGMRTVLAPVAEPGALAGEAGDAPAPFLPAAAAAQAGGTRAGRWSLDAWGFWRQGSDAAPISQGRVPIYGASQVGALLQYRLAPGSARDPRLHARAYRALVRRGESEVALGASARPLGRVPVRVFGELRLTDGAFRTQARAAAFAVTELPPIALPLGARLETYAQGGWVGGIDDTLFADGQASVTREVGAIARASDNALRFSLGAAAWGGAQEGAHRVDLGPTMRLDLTVGEVPARLSLDWRERVEGDAGPESGVAVTLSTSF